MTNTSRVLGPHVREERAEVDDGCVCQDGEISGCANLVERGGVLSEHDHRTALRATGGTKAPEETSDDHTTGVFDAALKPQFAEQSEGGSTPPPTGPHTSGFSSTATPARVQ